MTSLVSISEFCRTGSGGTPSRKINEYYSGTIPWIKSGELRENIIAESEEHISEAALKESSAKMIPAGAILVAMYGATVGRMGILGVDAATNQAVCNIIPDKKKADIKYVFHALQARVPELLKKSVGGAQPNISQQIIKETKIPLPPLPEQKRIAAILDKADDIRRKRRQALALADQFLRAVFLEMFGDPVTNPKGWPIGTIRDLLSDVKYGTSKKADPSQGAFPVLRMGNITYDGGWNLSDLKYIDLDEREQSRHLASRDDILFNRTNSKELVGKTAVYDLNKPMAFSGYLVRARVNEKADPYYIAAYLNSDHGKATLKGMCKNIIGMANINAQEMQDICIAHPPVDIQRDYRRVIEAARKGKGLRLDGVQEAEHLFGSLTQRAFRGEL